MHGYLFQGWRLIKNHVYCIISCLFYKHLKYIQNPSWYFLSAPLFALVYPSFVHTWSCPRQTTHGATLRSVLTLMPNTQCHWSTDLWSYFKLISENSLRFYIKLLLVVRKRRLNPKCSKYKCKLSDSNKWKIRILYEFQLRHVTIA